MRPKYNVLEEGWIPVVALDGERRLLGIRETLAQAHELGEISVASPLEEYGLYRFLGVFLMDALRPETEEDLEDLLDEGRFDMGQIEKYIDLCRREGVSFDLFDEKRPFLQSAYDEKMDKEVKSIANLDPTVPSGNNHTHFDHRKNVELQVTFDKAARLLISFFPFATIGGRGYIAGINGTPPYYSVVHGTTLFSTLMYTLLPLEKISMPFDKPPTLWRCKEKIRPVKLGETSWLLGMIFPARRITLIPNQNTVSEMNFSPGYNFKNKDSWTDPYVTYSLGKNDAVRPLRPESKEPIWMNYNNLISTQLLHQYRSLFRHRAARVTLYGATTERATFFNVCKYDFRFYAVLSTSQEKTKMLQNCIEGVRKIGESLRDAVAKVKISRSRWDNLKNKKEEIQSKEWADRFAVQQFNQRCEERFWILCDQLLPEQSNLRVLRQKWCDEVGQCALDVFQESLGSLRLRASALAKAEEARNGLWKTIQNKRKEASK